MSATTPVVVKRRAAKFVKPRQSSARIIEALPGSTYHIPKLVVKKGDWFSVRHSGGDLRIDHVEVEEGGTFEPNWGTAPAGWKINIMDNKGGSDVMNIFRSDVFLFCPNKKH